MGQSIPDQWKSNCYPEHMSYEDYLNIHALLTPEISPMSEQAYAMFYDVFECDMENASNN